MTTAEERMKILEMIRGGTISADEGTRLLAALQSQAKRQTMGGDVRDARWMRVKVTDLKSGSTKVSVNIPMGLVRVGIKMGARFTPRDTNIDYAGIMDALQNGATGKVVDLENKDENERVEIWVD